MANQIGMAQAFAIGALLDQGWSHRRIAAALGVHRETVARYARLRSEPAIAPIGSNAADGPANAVLEPLGTDPKPATAAEAPHGSAGSTRSRCEEHRELICAKLGAGLSAQRIWQDLATEHGIHVSYHSVKRFVRTVRGGAALPFRRLECEPGAEAQLDFGTAAPVVRPDGRRRHPKFLRITLSHSRKGYTEAVYRRTAEELIRCLENAFHAFGGVPATLVFDNEKAAVLNADWFDPDLNPKLAAFCAHYGTVLLPTKPRTPRHKGKVERGVGYVQDNALKGRVFPSLAEQNQHLEAWEQSVADTRIHGTIRRQVRQVFEECERSALRPLPAERFPHFEEATRIVHRDGHVEVAKAYYPVPPEHMGREVWVRWDARVVRIFDRRLRPIVVHARIEPGRFATGKQFIHPHKVSAVERGAGRLLEEARLIGPQTGRWAKSMLEARGVPGIRVLVGLHTLARKHTADQIERACAIALGHGSYRLRAIRQLIARGGPSQETMGFMDEHPIIRTLDEYAKAAHVAIHHPHARAETHAHSPGPLHRPRSWTPGLPPEGAATHQAGSETAS